MNARNDILMINIFRITFLLSLIFTIDEGLLYDLNLEDTMLENQCFQLRRIVLI